jgi:hypothetical protein
LCSTLRLFELLSVFGSMAAGAFQITFRVKIYDNDFFFIF